MNETPPPDHITIDIVKSLFLHENVDVILIISGDRDYVPIDRR